MRTFRPPTDNKKPSLLERMARKIEPNQDEKAFLESKKELPTYSRVMRRIKGLMEIDPSLRVMFSRARPTGAQYTSHDGEVMRFWSDGSVRHAFRVKGKAFVKRTKRARQLFKQTGAARADWLMGKKRRIES